MSDPDAFCPRCGQSRDDGLAWNRNACGHEWHGEETLAGPGEDGPEPPDMSGEDTPDEYDGITDEEYFGTPAPRGEVDRIAAETLERASTIGQQSRLRTVGVAQEIDPVYRAQETGPPDRVDPYGLGGGRAFDAHREELEGPPRTAVDPDDDRFAEAVYAAYLSEPYGLVPWERLGDHAHDAYRRSAHRARELLGAGPAAPEPQRVVVGFGSPAVVAEVLATLRTWLYDGAPATDEIERLIERIEQGE